MQLSDAGNQLPSRPAPNATVNPGWINNNPSGSSPATTSDPDQINGLFAELLFIITTLAGLVFSKLNTTQLAQALNQLFGFYSTDTGAANAYVTACNPAVTTRITGTRVTFIAAHANTGPSTLNYGGGAVALVNADGAALQANQIVANQAYTAVDIGSAGMQLLSPTTSSVIGNGACTLSTTGSTNVTLLPFNGNGLTIAGARYAIPTGGIPATTTSCFVNGVAAQALAASTLYYIYVFNNAGTLALDFSTTAHATDSTAGNVGVEIESGNNSRTLVGMCFTDASAHINDTTGKRNLRSWFDRRGRDFQASFSGTTTATTPTQLSSAAGAVAEICLWINEIVNAAIAGSVNVNAANAAAQVNIGVDGGTLGIGSTSTSATASANQAACAQYGSSSLSEGHHTLSMFGAVPSTDTGTYSIALFGRVA